MAPWSSLAVWQPFSLDAAGFLTLIGAEQVNHSVGRLVSSRYLEWMPFLAPFVISGDEFIRNIPGYTLLNLTDGLRTTNLPGWFVRILLSHEGNIAPVSTFLRISVVAKAPPRTVSNPVALFTSLCITGFLFPLAILSNDWYGFASSLGVVVSVFCRVHQVNLNRSALDYAVEHDARDHPGTYEYEFRAWQKKGSVGTPPDANARTNGDPWQPSIARCILVTPEEKLIALEVPHRLIGPVLSKNLSVYPRTWYAVVRWFSWAAFAVHIVALNLASLALKIYTSALLVIATILFAGKFGCEDSMWSRLLHIASRRVVGRLPDNQPHLQCHIGTRIKLEVLKWPFAYEFNISDDGKPVTVGWDAKEDFPRSRKRQDFFAWMQLTEKEMRFLERWELVTPEYLDDDPWLQNYVEKKNAINLLTGGVRGSR